VLRRCSGEELSSGEEVAVDEEPLRGLSRSGSSCWACLKAKRGTMHASWSWQHRRKAWQLGRRRRNVEKLARGREAAARVLGWHVAWLRVARGGRCAAHGRRERRQSGTEKTEESGAGGRRRGCMCNSSEM
jgi:hypothetical protein